MKKIPKTLESHTDPIPTSTKYVSMVITRPLCLSPFKGKIGVLIGVTATSQAALGLKVRADAFKGPSTRLYP